MKRKHSFHHQLAPTKIQSYPSRGYWKFVEEVIVVGYVSFVAKTKLINHYIETLGAVRFGNQLMVINTDSALKLINKYF